MEDCGSDTSMKVTSARDEPIASPSGLTWVVISMLDFTDNNSLISFIKKS